MAKTKGSPKGKAAATKSTAVKGTANKTVSAPKKSSTTLAAKGKERSGAVKSTRTVLPGAPCKRKNTVPHDVECDDDDGDGDGDGDDNEDDVVKDEDQEQCDDQDDRNHDSEAEEGSENETDEDNSDARQYRDVDSEENQTDDATYGGSDHVPSNQYKISYGFEDNGSHIPPDPRDRSKNGRQQGRNLIIWHRPCMDEKCLLFYHYECIIHGIVPPMDAIAHRMNPGSSAGAINQHFSRLRDEILGKGHLVPPPVSRPKGYEVVDEHLVRGYIRVDKPGSPRIQVRAVSFDEYLPDNQHNRVGFNPHDKMNENIWDRADIVDKHGNIIITAEERKMVRKGSGKLKMNFLKDAKTKGKAQQDSSSEEDEALASKVPAKAKAALKTKAKAKSAPKTQATSKTNKTAVPAPELVSEPSSGPSSEPLFEKPSSESAHEPTPDAAPELVPVPKSAPATKSAPKQRAAAKSKKAAPVVETSSSDAEYNPSAKATPKRRRTSRAKRVKTYHEPDSDPDLEEASSVTSEPAIVNHSPSAAHDPCSPNNDGLFHVSTNSDSGDEVDEVVVTTEPQPQQSQHMHRHVNHGAAAFEAQMSQMTPINDDNEVISPPVTTHSMATPDAITPDMVSPANSSQYAQSIAGHNHSSPSEFSPSEVGNYNPSIDMVTDIQVQQMNESLHHQGFLPMSVFTRTDQLSTLGFSGHHDGASPSSTTFIAAPTNGDFYFGQTNGYGGSMHKSDPGLPGMPGMTGMPGSGFVYPHQTFGMGMASMIGQGIGGEQGHVSGADLHNGHIYSHGYPGGST